MNSDIMLYEFYICRAIKRGIGLDRLIVEAVRRSSWTRVF